jgi:hypothetical protein
MSEGVCLEKQGGIEAERAERVGWRVGYCGSDSGRAASEQSGRNVRRTK